MEKVPPIKALTDYRKMLINDMLETIAIMQITHGNSDEEWFVAYLRPDDHTIGPYYLCTGRRSR